MLLLSHELHKINGIDQRFLSRLNKLNIITVKDLIWHFPSRYEDFSQISKVCDLEPDQIATVQVQIKKINLRRSWKRRLAIVEAVAGDETGNIKVIWFNQPYIAKTLGPGKVTILSGKVTLNQDEIYFSSPSYGHNLGLLPVYPETKGLTSKGLRYLTKAIIKNLKKLDEFIPDEILEKNDLPEINQAIFEIHFPTSLDEAKKGRERFAFEDIFLLQLYNAQNRTKLAKEKAKPVNFSSEDLAEIGKSISFELTDSQKQALVEIFNDIKKNQPMNRLLQGDVGSGKTIVAAIAALLVAKNSGQTAFLAPTEVLSRQHYQTLTKFFSPIISKYELTLGLLTGSEARYFAGENLETKVKKTDLIKQISEGKIKILVGTHAIIQKEVGFRNLVLSVVDEQHRFGVRQRAQLAVSNNGKILPHFLSMSATPIPRTLSMTLFGDLDLSLITELPKGRQPIITKIVARANRQKAYEFIRQQIEQGRQAFVICPRIEASDPNLESKDKLNLWTDVKAVEEEYKKLSEDIFPDLKVKMLHGRLKSMEKNEIMSDFSKNNINILVSTSVIEIGVDIPNATIMMIEGADRFGLAQLYQFRGRVGRGEHQSYCFLLTDSSSATTHRRLKYLLEAKNGFELAEKDLALRGPGQFLGQGQTGLPDLAMSSLGNVELIKAARESADYLIKKDPEVNLYPALKEKLEEFKKRVHLE